MESLIAAGVAFVGSHFLLSHSLRKPVVGALGERGFMGVYSLVALATFAWVVVAYRAIPAQPLWWIPGDTLWAIASAAMLVGAILFIGSLLGNPAMPGASAGREVSGVFAITRHPMMWGFAIWALVHLAVYPTDAHAVLTATILILALVGAALQDRKKEQLVPDWREWEARTSYWPFAAQIAGRARWTLGDARALLGGLALWLIATWLHPAAMAGIWRWLV